MRSIFPYLIIFSVIGGLFAAGVVASNRYDTSPEHQAHVAACHAYFAGMSASSVAALCN
jgi:hypothetical protein